DTTSPVPSPEPAVLPAIPADGYRELIELDRASAARQVPAPAPRGARLRTLEPSDRRLLELVATLGHVLSRQLHRHVNQGRAASTPQRRLRRLAEAGLVARLQMHRPDGGGVPMAYALTPAGEEALRTQDPALSAQLLLGSEPGGASVAVVR